MLGEAQTNRVAPIAGDAVSLEIVLGALGDPSTCSAAFATSTRRSSSAKAKCKRAAPITDAIRAYVGGWPRPHLLDQFLGRPSGPLDADGIARTGRAVRPLVPPRRRFLPVLVQARRAARSRPSTRDGRTAEHPAQIRLHIDDLTNKQIATTVNGLGYMRARDTSASASRFMNSLTTQLHVAPEKARTLGEDLVAGQFACPLGGKYVFVDPV